MILAKVIAGLGLAGATLVATPATADTTAAAPQPEATTQLGLSVVPGDGGAITTNAAHGVNLMCDPPSGTHPAAAQACADLAAANGEIANIAEDQTVFCPQIFEPVTALALGTWRGELVVFMETFPNSCVLAAQTGAVFQF